VIRLTDLLENPAQAEQDSCPSWCVGGHDEAAEPECVTEFDGPSGTEAGTDAIARLMQDGGADAVIELAVHDADESEAVVRLSLDQASELVELLTHLITEAHLG
jgi:hypothetical protein